MRCPRLEELPPPQASKTGWPWTGEGLPLSDLMPNGKPWPKVSIVTPSYNQGEFIEETIRSVLLQDYPNLEYIVIDGGSTDESVSVIKKYSRWLTYWVSERDEGQANAINKGWKRATGEVVAYINSDDTYHAGSVSRAVSMFIQFPKIKAVYGGCFYVDEDGKTIREFSAEPFCLRKMLQDNIISQPSTFLRHTVLEEVGLIDETMYYYFDYDLWLRIAKHDPDSFGTVTEILSNFRLHSKSKTNILKPEYLEERIRILESFFEKNNLPNDVLSLQSKLLATTHWRVGLKYWIFDNVSSSRYHIGQVGEYLATILSSPKFFNELVNYHLTEFGLTAPRKISQMFKQVIGSFQGKHFIQRRAEAKAYADLVLYHRSRSKMFNAIHAVIRDSRYLGHRGIIEALAGCKIARFLSWFKSFWVTKV